MHKEINPKREKDEILFKRLILSKRFFIHALEHSYKDFGFDDMIAVHNFHVSIEITLRSILLHYEIRSTNELNINFEQMIKEIEKKTGQKIPYFKEIFQLNRTRNLVQHDAVEPPNSTMEQWRVFTKSFLEESFKKFFDLNFDEISTIHFVRNHELRKILMESRDEFGEKEYQKSIVSSKNAFLKASKSIRQYFNKNRPYSPLTRIIARSPSILSGTPKKEKEIIKWQFKEIDDKNKYIIKKMDDQQRFFVILSTGVKASDLKRFYETPPVVELTVGGKPLAWGENNSKKEAKWILDFVTETIIKWQKSGFELKE